jgi:hypothetical protein
VKDRGQLSFDELLAMFSQQVHGTLAQLLNTEGVEGCGVFENVTLDSSELGSRSALVYGPSCTYKSWHEMEGQHLKDLPSQRQEFVAYFMKDGPVPILQNTAGTESIIRNCFSPPGPTTEAPMTGTQEDLVEWMKGSTAEPDEVTPMSLVFGRGKEYQTAVKCRRAADNEEWIYVVGSRPYKKRKVCYRFEGDGRDWYLSSYLDDTKELTDQQRAYHFYGVPGFSLRPWQVPNGERIDAHYHVKYQRIPVTVTIGV